MTKRDAKAKLSRLAQDLGRFPLIDELAQVWGLSPSQTKSVLTMWVKDAYLLESPEGAYQINPAYKSRTVSGSVTGTTQSEPELIIPEPEKDRDPEPFIEMVTEKPKAPKQKKPSVEPSTDDALDAVRVAAEYQAQSESSTPEPGDAPASEIVRTYKEIAQQLPAEPITYSLLSKKRAAFMQKVTALKTGLRNWKPKLGNVKNLFAKFKRTPKKVPTRKPQRQSGVVTLIRVVMGAIGIGAAVISMYYTSRFTQELFPYAFLAYLLSGIMVGFNIMAFELILLFGNGQATTHWFRWPAAFAFFMLWIVVGGFSITATVAGQYNQRAKNTMTTAVASGNPQAVAAKWQNILARKFVYENQIKNSQEQNTTLNAKLKEMAPDNLAYANTNWYITNNDVKIADANIKLTEIRVEEAAMLKEHPEVLQLVQSESEGGGVPDFYAFLARVFGATRDVVQFWVSLFPAVFVDVIAPIAAAAALFLRGKK